MNRRHALPSARARQHRLPPCGVVFSLLLASTSLPPLAHAEIKGDLDLLKLTAAAYTDNRGRILSWQGTAQVEMSTEDEAGPRNATRNSASFLFDQVQNAVRWSWTVQERKERNGNQLAVVPPDPYVIHEMRKGDRFYRHAPGLLQADGQKDYTLVIYPGQEALSRQTSDSFDPTWYLTKQGSDLAEKLLFYQREARNPNMSDGSVKREGNLVILETQLSGTVNRWKFDLDQGGNLVSYYSESDQGKAVIEWTYANVDGAWVPKTYTNDGYDKSRDGKFTKTKRVVVFTRNTLNKPIDPSEFTLQKLGVKAGTYTTDRILGIAYRYAGDTPLTIAKDTPGLKNAATVPALSQPPATTPPLPGASSFSSPADAAPTPTPAAAQPPDTPYAWYIMGGLAAVAIVALILMLQHRRSVPRRPA